MSLLLRDEEVLWPLNIRILSSVDQKGNNCCSYSRKHWLKKNPAEKTNLALIIPFHGYSQPGIPLEVCVHWDLGALRWFINHTSHLLVCFGKNSDTGDWCWALQLLIVQTLAGRKRNVPLPKNGAGKRSERKERWNESKWANKARFWKIRGQMTQGLATAFIKQSISRLFPLCIPPTPNNSFSPWREKKKTKIRWICRAKRREQLSQ